MLVIDLSWINGAAGRILQDSSDLCPSFVHFGSDVMQCGLSLTQTPAINSRFIASQMRTKTVTMETPIKQLLKGRNLRFWFLMLFWFRAKTSNKIKRACHIRYSFLQLSSVAGTQLLLQMLGGREWKIKLNICFSYSRYIHTHTCTLKVHDFHTKGHTEFCKFLIACYRWDETVCVANVRVLKYLFLLKPWIKQESQLSFKMMLQNNVLTGVIGAKTLTHFKMDTVRLWTRII